MSRKNKDRRPSIEQGLPSSDQNHVNDEELDDVVLINNDQTEEKSETSDLSADTLAASLNSRRDVRHHSSAGPDASTNLKGSDFNITQPKKGSISELERRIQVFKDQEVTPDSVRAAVPHFASFVLAHPKARWTNLVLHYLEVELQGGHTSQQQ